MKNNWQYSSRATYSRNKIFRTVLTVASIAVMLLGASLFGFTGVNAANEQINFQARLLSDTGALVQDGDYHVEFKIYCGGDGSVGGGADPGSCAAATGTAEHLQWTETHTTGNLVTVKNGYVTAKLGSINSTLASAVDWGQNELWLTINIGGTGGAASWDGEMDPMLRFTSVPYAFDANYLDGRDSSDFVQIDLSSVQTVNSSNPAIYLNQTGSGDIFRLQDGGSDIFTIVDGGWIGIGDATPDATLDLQVLSAADPGLLIQGHASQSADLMRVVSSGGTEYFSIDSSGNLYFTQLNCSGMTNGGALTTDGTGQISCSADDGGLGGGSTTLQGAYDADISGDAQINTSTGKDILFSLSDSLTDSNFRVVINDNSTSTVSITRADGPGSADPAQLLVINNADTNRGIADGLLIQAAAGGLTDAIDVSDPDITNAINIGANTITGTNAIIDFTSFSLASNGNISTGGDVSIQGGNATLGNAIIQGELVINDGNGQATTLYAGDSTGNLTFTLPTANPSSNDQCLKSTTAGVFSFSNCNNGSGGGGAVTLQDAYDASTSPELTVDSTRGALTIQDASSPIGANLFEVTANGGGTTYFAVSASSATLGVNTTASANLTVTNTFTANGNTVLGNANTDTLTIASSVSNISFSDASLQTCTLKTNVSGVLTCGTDNTGSGVSTVGTIDSQTKSSDGAVISGSNIYLQTADATNPGLVSTGAQTFAGNKTLSNNITVNGNTTLGDAVGDTLTVNATSTFNESITVAATKTLRLTGGTTAQRPGSPTEGMLFFDTDTDTLLTYSNGKWQADRGEYVIVAANDSTQAEKDSADYVADGTDDQVQINAALTEASGGKVLLLAGTYTTHQTDNGDATILVPNNTTLAGVGNGTVIQLGDIDATDNLIQNTDTATGTGVTMQDFKVDGQKDLNTAGAQYGIYLNNMGAGSGSSARQGAVIENIKIYDFSADGLRLFSSSNNVISGVDSSANDFGVHLRSNSNNNRIIGGNYQGNTTSGVYLYQSSRNTVNGNTSENNYSSGIHLSSGSSNNTINGNTSQNNSFAGIYIFFSHYNSVQGNSVVQNGDKGIQIQNSDYNVIGDNNIHDSDGSAFNNGIYIDGGTGSDYNSIVNNIITDTSATTVNYAINVNGSSQNQNYLANNTLGTGSINDAGTGTIYGGQVDGSGNYDIQPSGSISLLKNTDITGNLTVSGTSVFTGAGTFNGNLTVGNANTDTLIINAGSSGSGIAFGDVSFQSCTALETNASGVLVCGSDDVGGGSGVDTVGAVDSQTKSSDGAVISGTTIYLQTADASNVGLVSTGVQTFAGNKTFSGTLTVSNTLTANANIILGNSNTDTLTINAGSSGTGISFGDSSFANCSALETVAGILSCGTDDTGGGGSGAFTSSGGVTSLVTSTDSVTIGSATQLAKFAVDGDSDEVQFLVQGHSTQTSNLLVLEQSDGSDVFTVGGTGKVLAKTSTDATDAFLVQNSLGQTALGVDTQNMRVGIGTDSAEHLLHTYGGDVYVETGIEEDKWDITKLEQHKFFNLPSGSFTDMVWNNDGTKLYVVRSASILEYALSSAFDVSTATYVQLIATQDTSPEGIAWNNDGTKLYEIGRTGDRIYEYNVSTAYNISTATYSQQIPTQDLTPTGLTWNNDGTKLYEVGQSGDAIYESNVSTPYDISTATYTRQIATQDLTPTGLTWNNDGTKLYEIGAFGDAIYEYNVSTAYDISSASYAKQIVSQEVSPTGISWNSDGTKFYEVGSYQNKIYEFSVSSAYDISSVVRAVIPEITTQDSGTTGIAWNNDGTKFYETGYSGDAIYEYNVSTVYNISTATYSQQIPTQDLTPTGITWNNDGTKLYEIGSVGDAIYEYTVSTAFDISTATYSQQIPTQDTNPQGLAWNNDGTKLYEVGSTVDAIYEYTVSTAFDISTATYSQQIPTQGAEPHGIDWSSDGTKLYESGRSPGVIYQYSVSTAFDISSASYSTQINTKNIYPTDIVWSSDGTKLYESSTNKITEYTINPESGNLTVENTFRLKSVSWTPTTPTSGYSQLYVKTDNRLYYQDETGKETALSANTIQEVYTFSEGGAVPEIKLDFDRGGLDIQDADTTFGGNLFTIRASNASGLGSELFSVSSTGKTSVKTSTDSSDAFSVQNSSSDTLVSANTNRMNLGIGTNTPKHLLHTYGGDIYVESSHDTDKWNIAKLDYSNIATQDASPAGMTWNNDGTKLYEVGHDGDKIYEYIVSSPYDTSTATFYSQQIPTQGTIPTGITWNNDGTKLYEVDSQSRKIHEYIVSSPYVISSASYSKQITAQDTVPQGITWNNDGTKLYETGGGSGIGKIYEYNVSTPYDISTAVYSQQMNTQDSYPRGIAWNNDGTKLYNVDDSPAAVYEYNVSTPYDISTATYSLYIVVTASSPADLTWNNNGTQLFVVSDGSNQIYTYNVSTPYEITTAYPRINTQNISPQDVSWNNDGTKLYEVDSFGDKIYEYIVSTPYSVSTAVYYQEITTQDTNPTGITWNNDGTKLYEVGSVGDAIYEYTVSTPYDISTATYSQQISTTDSSPQGVTWGSNGTKLYVIGSQLDRVYEYTVSTPYDISTVSTSQFIATQDSTPTGLTWNNDGTKLYEVGSFGDKIYQYTVSSTFDISTATYLKQINTKSTNPTGIAWNNDGTKILEIGYGGANGNIIYEYTVNKLYDIGNASHKISIPTYEKQVSTQATGPEDITWNNDGTKLYEVDPTTDRIYEYAVSIPFDISTAIYSQEIATQDLLSTGISWNNDGTKLYEAGSSGDVIYESNVSTPYDISTAVYSQQIPSQDTSPQGIAWNNEGTKLYEIGYNGRKIYEYSVSTPYDISTAVYSQQIPSQDFQPRDITWNNDGTKLYEVGWGSDKVYEYSVSTAFDISTATYTQQISSSDSTTNGIAWNNDGSKLYTVGSSTDTIYEATIQRDDGNIIVDGTFSLKELSLSPSSVNAGFGQLYVKTDNQLYYQDDNGVEYAVAGSSTGGAGRSTLVPEYPGGTLTPDGSNNNGTMTAEFCSGTGLKSINTTVCGTTEEHNYYTWTTSQSTDQDYDIWVRHQLETDTANATSTFNIFGWRTDGTNNAVNASLYNATGAQCGATTNVATGTATWTETAIASVSGDADCDMAQNDIVTIRIQMVASQNEYARVGEIRIDY